MPTYNRFTENPAACHICGREVKEYHNQASYNIHCTDDLEECFENRIKTRILEAKHMALDPKYVPDFDKQMDLVWRAFRSAKIMQMADFVVLAHENGGIEFIKDRYEDSKGKVYFAE